MKHGLGTCGCHPPHQLHPPGLCWSISPASPPPRDARLPPHPSADTRQHGLRHLANANRHGDGQTSNVAVTTWASQPTQPRTSSNTQNISTPPCTARGVGWKQDSRASEPGNKSSASTNDQQRCWDRPAWDNGAWGKPPRSNSFQRIPTTGANPTSRAILALWALRTDPLVRAALARWLSKQRPQPPQAREPARLNGKLYLQPAKGERPERKEALSRKGWFTFLKKMPALRRAAGFWLRTELKGFENELRDFGCWHFPEPGLGPGLQIQSSGSPARSCKLEIWG